MMALRVGLNVRLRLRGPGDPSGPRRGGRLAGLPYGSSLGVLQHVDRRDELGHGLPAVGDDALDGTRLHRVADLEGNTSAQPRHVLEIPFSDVAAGILIRAPQEYP